MHATRLLMGTALLAVLAWPSSARTEAEAGFVLPGDYAQGTTVAELEARFGKANVRLVETMEGGIARQGLVLFPDDPVRRAYVDFHGGKLVEGIQRIAVRDTGSRWRGKHGVQIGMSLAELRGINGKPFGLLGFDAGRRAIAHDQWSPALDGDGGSLGALDVEEGEHMYFGVELGVCATSAEVMSDAYPHDDLVSSDDPRYPRLGELVEVTVLEATTSLDDEWD